MKGIEILSTAGLAGKTIEIVSEEGGGFAAYLLQGTLRTEVWARAASPGKLSEVAFFCGVQEVRHSYDLVEEHQRFHRGER